MENLSFTTRSRTELLNISAELQELVRRKGLQSGALALFCPHTTCALSVNEGADPNVAEDICRFTDQLVPRDKNFRHAEGNSDAHIKTSLFGPSLLLFVEDGHLRLGAWQTVYLCEFDGPRRRMIWTRFLRDAD